MNNLTDNSVASQSLSFVSDNNHKATKRGGTFYSVSKRIFDLIVSCAAMPVFVVICATIFLLNFFWNRGPLFFFQTRMGKDKRKYVMVKFRTMLPEQSTIKRGPFDELEHWRVTPFGRWMRMTRLDEVPQILNVILGQMSLVGPRPEIFEFAQTYYKKVPGYHVRGTVRPGITGYSQVTQGYTDSEEAIHVKTQLDTFYVRNMNWWLDLKVLFWTVGVVFTSNGAR